MWRRAVGRPTGPVRCSSQEISTQLLYKAPKLWPNVPRQSIRPSRFQSHCQHSIPAFTGPWRMLGPMPSRLEPVPFKDEVSLNWGPSQGALQWSVEPTPGNENKKSSSRSYKVQKAKQSSFVYRALIGHFCGVTSVLCFSPYYLCFDRFDRVKS